MSDLPKPMFLERQSYRRRRIIDAWLILPVFGAFLVFIPLLWEEHSVQDRPFLAEKGLYIFAVWFCLVAVSAVLSRLLTRIGRSGTAEASEDSPDDAETTES